LPPSSHRTLARISHHTYRLVDFWLDESSALAECQLAG
jgi:hypothetical protein